MDMLYDLNKKIPWREYTFFVEGVNNIILNE